MTSAGKLVDAAPASRFGTAQKFVWGAVVYVMADFVAQEMTLGAALPAKLADWQVKLPLLTQIMTNRTTVGTVLAVSLGLLGLGLRASLRGRRRSGILFGCASLLIALSALFLFQLSLTVLPRDARVVELLNADSVADVSGCVFRVRR
jgi:hypothetical protein